jgi:uncharacterized protein YdaU (DUF1376 family)
VSNSWYARYPGDYGRDTAHLSMIEHGAYGLLLDHYYSTAAPLPADVTALYRVCRAFDQSERDAVDCVLSQFFELRSDGYHNGRADMELVKRDEHHDRLSTGARKTNEKRWGNRPATRPATRSATRSALASPQPQPQPQEEKHQHPFGVSASPGASLESETKAAAFAVFWERWPRKEAKSAASRAWSKIPVAEYAPIMAGLEKWILSDQWKRGIIPHAATWLNGKRWTDEVPQGGSNGTGTRKQTATDLALQNAKALGLGQPN